MCKFSILIPVYNVEKFIDYTIQSVLNQNFNSFEIILIDDGSTDNSLSICRKYEKMDKRVRVYTQNNQGLISTRGQALTKANGDYIIFLDSDDYWDNGTLQELDVTLKNENCDLIIFKYKRVSEKGEFISENIGVFEDNSVFDKSNKSILYSKMLSTTSLNNLVCKVIKKSIYSYIDYNYYKNVNNGEDLLQTLPIIDNANKIIYRDKAYYNYRTNSNSITNKFNINFYKDVTIVREKLQEYIEKYEINTKDNMSLFYLSHLKSISSYIQKLVLSQVTKKERVYILNAIKQTLLFQSAIENIHTYELKYEYRVIIFLMKKNLYNLIYFFVYFNKFFTFVSRKLKILIGRN